MVFAPKERRWSLGTAFPSFSLGNEVINFVSQFKYLGHMLTDCLSDDVDISREIRNIFVRTNILIRKFSNCSLDVKAILFKTYCLCFYDIALWTCFNLSSLKKFRSCYNIILNLSFKNALINVPMLQLTVIAIFLIYKLQLSLLFMCVLFCVFCFCYWAMLPELELLGHAA